jgi:hypothetical protein
VVEREQYPSAPPRRPEFFQVVVSRQDDPVDDGAAEIGLACSNSSVNSITPGQY